VNKDIEMPTLFDSQKHAIDEDKNFIEIESGSIDFKAREYWNKCLEIIKDNVNIQVFRTWFEPLKALKYENNQLIIKVPSQYFCEWIEVNFYPLLQKTIFEVLGENAKLQYRIVVDKSEEPDDVKILNLPAFRHAPPVTQPVYFAEPFSRQEFHNNLNSRYTLDNFICGESNQLACSAGMAISQNPGRTRFNPLVIYGDTGLGKTHLAQGIGNQIIQKNHKIRVLYTTSERFTMEFVNAIQNNKTNDFINFYRSVDVLIVDDIQFFGGKEKTQDNFFHTFNALHQAGKQLVLTSDKAPKNLQDVDDRLISRFQWGLTADIQAPDYEMRMAILQKKSIDEGLELPGDIIDYIARNVSTSVRELEGILISIIAKVTLDRRELTLDLAREVVHGIAITEPKSITIEDIISSVSTYYKLIPDKLISKSRKHEIALARQMAIYISKKLTQNSLKTIGTFFGGRDHSTVLHSCQTIENYISTDPKVKNTFDILMKKLQK
jgi:chromosomal replication initiator protein